MKFIVHFKSFLDCNSLAHFSLWIMEGCPSHEKSLSHCPLTLKRCFTLWDDVVFILQGIIFKSAKKKKGMTVGFVSFESTEQLKSAVEVSLVPNLTSLIHEFKLILDDSSNFGCNRR